MYAGARSRRGWCHQRRHGEGSRVRDIKEVCDVEGRGGQAVEDADRPALLGEALVPGVDVAPRVGVHVRVASVPEEPDVFLI